MMNRAEIQKFFLLENYPQLFETALSPRSCGGDAKFEQLALYGDRVINMHLLDYLISEGLQTKGDITRRNSTIHHRDVIKAFADDLGIPDILTPADSTTQLQNNDLKEIVEALIGATFQSHGLKTCLPIIQSFLEFVKKRQETSRKRGEFDKSHNYIGDLLELFQKKHLDKPNLEQIRIRGADNLRIYQFKGDITFDGIKHEITSQPWPEKKLAEQEAAYLVLLAISGNNAEYKMFDPTKGNMPASQEKTVHSTTSIDDDKLIFFKPAFQNGSMEVKHNTDEFLVDWVDRKAKKNVFGMLTLLSARLNNVSGASWICELSSGVLALINLQLGENEYFALGFGPSKSKARIAAGEDMLMKVNLVEWIEKHYPNHKI